LSPALLRSLVALFSEFFQSAPHVLNILTSFDHTGLAAFACIQMLPDNGIVHPAHHVQLDRVIVDEAAIHRSSIPLTDTTQGIYQNRPDYNTLVRPVS